MHLLWHDEARKPSHILVDEPAEGPLIASCEAALHGRTLTAASDQIMSAAVIS